MKKYKYFRKIVLTNKDCGVIITQQNKRDSENKKVSKRRISESKI